jgi:hypothetical protein
MKDKKKIAIQRFYEFIHFLERIANSHGVSNENPDSLQSDKKALYDMLVMLENANSKTQYHELFRKVDDFKHIYGGYIGHPGESKLTRNYEKLWKSVFDLL